MTSDADTVVAADRPDPVIAEENNKEEKQVTTRQPRPGPPQRKKRPMPDPDQFLKLAKTAAVRNFNENRDPDRSKPIDETQVHIAAFSKVMSHWKAVVTSPVARNILWEVTYNSARNQVYVDTYRKISNSMVQLEEGE